MRIELESHRWSFVDGKAMWVQGSGAPSAGSRLDESFLDPIGSGSGRVEEGVIEQLTASSPHILCLLLEDLRTIDQATGASADISYCFGLVSAVTDKDIGSGMLKLEIDDLVSPLTIRTFDLKGRVLRNARVSLAFPGMTARVQTDRRGRCRVLCPAKRGWALIEGDRSSGTEVIFSEGGASDEDTLVVLRSESGG